MSCISDVLHRRLHGVLTLNNERLLRIGNGELVRAPGMMSLRIGESCYIVPFTELPHCIVNITLGYNFSSHGTLVNCAENEVHLTAYNIVELAPRSPTVAL